MNPAKYKGLVPGLRTLIAEEGSKGLWKGFGPTFVGYSLQGLFKYGLYEVFKDYYMNIAALREMGRLRAETRYPFGSLVPLWSRQVRQPPAPSLVIVPVVT